MITLATLKNASAQQVFDQVATHLIKQGRRSIVVVNATGLVTCQYRGAGSTMCAAGCLIADDEYKAKMETPGMNGWQSLVRQGYAPVKHMDLITDLQSAHDTGVDGDKNIFQAELRRVAGFYELSTAVLDGSREEI